MQFYFSDQPIKLCGEAQSMSIEEEPNEWVHVDDSPTFDIEELKEWVHVDDSPTFDMSWDIDAKEIELGHIVGPKYLGYDVIITDNEGNRYNLKDVDIKSKHCITQRIPRKMKKMLKKKWGDKWLNHHPNVGFKYEVRGKELVKV